MAQATHDSTRVTRRVAITAALASAAVPMVAGVPALAIGTGEDAAAVAGSARAASVPGRPDPILDMITEHRKAWSALGEALHAKGLIEEKKFAGQPYSKTAYRRANQAEKKTGDYLAKVERKMAQIVPTTVLGLLAMFDYMAEIIGRGDDLFDPRTNRVFMRSVRTAIGNLAAAGTLPSMANA